MISSQNPKISVLMPVYNCELYIKEAVDSILNQTYRNFEFLIIDDASTDSTVSIIKQFNDSRIQLIEKPKNSGYTNSLNLGLGIAKGEFIARMDGDDISLPERFAKQISIFEANPEIILCGTLLSIIGENKIINLPENHEDIKLALLRGNSIAHPSVMFRNLNAKGFSISYDLTKEPAEDYDLWVRLLAVGKFHNLQEVLLQYRVHINQVSKKRETQQVNSALESRLKTLSYINYNFKDSEYVLLSKIMLLSSDVTFDEIKDFMIIKQKILFANSNNFFERHGFQKYLIELENICFQKYFVNRQRYSVKLIFQYYRIRGKTKFQLKLIDQLKLFIKSIIHYKN